MVEMVPKRWGSSFGPVYKEGGEIFSAHEQAGLDCGS